MTHPTQSARLDHRTASASRITRLSPPTPRADLAGALSNSSSEQTSYLSVRLNRFGGRVLATRSVEQQRNTLGVTGWRDSQPNSAGYRMVRPEGFLDPEANVVRYHARRQFSRIHLGVQPCEEAYPAARIRQCGKLKQGTADGSRTPHSAEATGRRATVNRPPVRAQQSTGGAA